ncbi:NAD(P)-binding protein, partial [Lojkania enalia]
IAITGAASGIGRTTAELLVQHGALLSLADVDLKSVVQLAKFMIGNGAKVFWKQVDSPKTKSLESLLCERGPAKQLGAVNVAGIPEHLGTVRNHNSTDYEAVFAVNVKGVSNCMSAELRNEGLGSIVNVASITGLVGRPSYSVYCTSKFAVIGITTCCSSQRSSVRHMHKCHCSVSLSNAEYLA